MKEDGDNNRMNRNGKSRGGGGAQGGVEEGRKEREVETFP